MIELLPSEYDDLAFLELAQQIVNGALAALQVHEVYLVHVDNWFDFKWLGFWSRGESKELRKLYVPPFNPNRVRLEKHFLWDANRSNWTSAGQGKPLHLRQPGRRTLAQPLDRWSKSAAFIWYSGNTVTNKAGSLMLYLSGADCYAWYASFMKDEQWTADGVRQITRTELGSFEESGRQMAPV
ncbi:MAG: hypothetical protein ACHRXM_00700 [Isosphaerales bacterium]